MTNEHRAAKDPLKYEDLVDHYKECSMGRKVFWRWVLGILVVIALGTTIPAISAAVSKYEADTRQDEQIKALQRSDDMMRSDLQEMKADIKLLVQRSGRSQ